MNTIDFRFFHQHGELLVGSHVQANGSARADHASDGACSRAWPAPTKPVYPRDDRLRSWAFAILLTGWLWILGANQAAVAGSIGFSVSLTADEVTITNTGSEAAYQVSIWTLDPEASWRKVFILSGDAGYLVPGKPLKGRRQATAPGSGLGRGDPVLVIVHDQAGGRIVQLAWRQSPPQLAEPLQTRFEGRNLHIHAGNSTVLATHAIAVPYEGIGQLTTAFTADGVPQTPLRHDWKSGSIMTIDSGAAQGGAWLVHETTQGDLQLQIVADGFPRGKEQVPAWLPWVRTNAMMISSVLAAVGLVLVVAGFLWRSRRKSEKPT